MQVRNARWDDSQKTQIVCEIMLDNGPFKDQWLPFRATKDDPVGYGQALFQDISAGKYGAVADHGA